MASERGRTTDSIWGRSSLMRLDQPGFPHKLCKSLSISRRYRAVTCNLSSILAVCTAFGHSVSWLCGRLMNGR
jgi:hypothetical protein